MAVAPSSSGAGSPPGSGAPAGQGADAPGGARPQITPALERARELAREHNLIPLRYSFIDDCETPVSAFLKLRALAPRRAGLPARVRRPGPAGGALVVHRHRPPQRAALVARRRRRPVRARRPRARAASCRRRSRTRRRSPAAPSASSATTSCARSSRSASPPTDPLGLPDMALMLSDALVIFDHLKHTVTILANADLVRGARRRARLRQGRREDRGAQARARRPGPAPAAAGARRARPPTFESNMPREQLRSDGRADRPLHLRRRRLPGRALAALVGAGPGRGLLDLPRPARGQPEPLHVLPGLRRLPGRRREPRAAADGHRPARLDQADRGHAPARRLARGGPPDRRRAARPTRRSAPST